MSKYKPKTYTVTLTLEVRDGSDPDEWDWQSLFDDYADYHGIQGTADYEVLVKDCVTVEVKS